MTDILVMIFGALGVAANILIYQMKSGKKILLSKMFSDFSWVLHYICLSAFSGAAIAGIGFIRDGVFFHQDKKWAQSKVWLWLFLVLSIISAFFTWESVFSILPAIASVLLIISLWKNEPLLICILAFPISTLMLVYNIYCISYFGIVNEILSLISALIGVIKIKKAKEEN
ncbi:MAG: YgjV family protein [Ruminococcaceae bacterium]|nr:YgjV family protein [Oscillospiraceae bacterium]